MAVTDGQAAVLRAYLTGDFDSYFRLRDRLDPATTGTGYTALLSAAFCAAVERRFAVQDSEAAVIEFVGAVRSQSQGLGEKVEPAVAERLIRAVYTDERIDDLSQETRLRTQSLLLAALIIDERLDDAGIDGFITEARKLADAWLR
jgi:hypothetical protein